MPGYDSIIKPKTSGLSISIEPVHNTLYSLLLLENNLEISGLSPRLIEIYNSMSEELKTRNRIVMNGLYHSVIPDKSVGDFETFLSELSKRDPEKLRDQTLSVYSNLYESKNGIIPVKDDILKSVNTYISFLLGTFGSDRIDIEVETEAYKYMVNPEKLKGLLVLHLTEMWDRFFKIEWENNKSLLEASVQAYIDAGIDHLDKVEAVKVLGCESMDCNWGLLAEKINNAKKVFLVPSVHLGPYNGKIHQMETGIIWLFYGSLMPEGYNNNTSELSKADVLIHLNALTDEIRLEILNLCSTGTEYSSTQLMYLVNVSHSAI
ncbi:MAG: hypothetical protein PF518_05720 [Spirochaetaceae bacterium]|jgi:hypothetical protein|nr:hypothetical protein [Spirochaetaceae bacterium]